jgi:hypothetical protein
MRSNQAKRTVIYTDVISYSIDNFESKKCVVNSHRISSMVLEVINIIEEQCKWRDPT